MFITGRPWCEEAEADTAAILSQATAPHAGTGTTRAALMRVVREGGSCRCSGTSCGGRRHSPAAGARGDARVGP